MPVLVAIRFNGFLCIVVQKDRSATKDKHKAPAHPLIHPLSLQG